jgi:hypothetical protein
MAKEQTLTYFKLTAKLYLSEKILLTDRRATIRSSLKVVYFLRTVWGTFLHSHTQPDTKEGIKNFPRHFSTTLVPSLTLQISDIVYSSLERSTLEFSRIICKIRDLDVWSRGKGKSNFLRYTATNRSAAQPNALKENSADR